ncbi:hypothetical protein D9M70_433470 [compost metagenome]
MAEQGDGGDAAGARAEDVEVLGSGDLQDDVDGFLQGLDVGRQAPLALRLGRVAPADDEGLQIVAQAEARQALFRRQVEHVELVDLWWHHQQRPLVHALGDGLVLDQLQHVIAIDHRAFGGGEVLADLEGVHVHLARHAAVFHQVLGQVGKTVQQALAAGFEEALDRCRVGHAVGGRHGLGHQVDDEVTATGVLFGEVAVLYPLMQFLAPGKVGLQVALVQRVLAPGRVTETAVVGFRLQAGLAEHHVLQFQAEMGDVFCTVERLLDGLQQHHPRGRQQILAADTYHRVEVQGVVRGLALQVFVVLVAHLRRSIVLSRTAPWRGRALTGSGYREGEANFAHFSVSGDAKCMEPARNWLPEFVSLRKLTAERTLRREYVARH